MADRYDEQERRQWRDVEDEERYGRGRNRTRLEGDYRQRERNYGYGDYGLENERRFDAGEYERRDLVERGYGYGDYGQEGERPYGRDRDYVQRQQRERGYGYGDYGQHYERRRRREWGYEPEWQRERGYGYGDYDQGYGRRYRSPRNYEESQTGRGYGDYSRQEGGGRYIEPTWTYTEVWLVPGPATGRGPHGYQRSNERIIEDACERLTHHGQLDASGIAIEVDNRIVTLKGAVSSRWQKRMAEDTVETVSGVRDVRNQLEIREEGGEQT